MDFPALRKKMAEEQLQSRGIQDRRVLEAFLKIERHRFIPEDLRGNAYSDFPVQIGEGQTISQPYMAALMSECLQLTGTEKVLEIGTGSGYQTALLAELAKEVYTIERVLALSERARKLLMEMGYTNIEFKTGDGTLGWKENAPFDRIIITAAAPRIPLPLEDELRNGGIMLAPIGDTNISQTLTLFEKKNGRFEISSVCGCVFVPLVGKYGFSET